MKQGDKCHCLHYDGNTYLATIAGESPVDPGNSTFGPTDMASRATVFPSPISGQLMIRVRFEEGPHKGEEEMIYLTRIKPCKDD